MPWAEHAGRRACCTATYALHGCCQLPQSHPLSDSCRLAWCFMLASNAILHCSAAHRFEYLQKDAAAAAGGTASGTTPAAALRCLSACACAMSESAASSSRLQTHSVPSQVCKCVGVWRRAEQKPFRPGQWRRLPCHAVSTQQRVRILMYETSKLASLHVSLHRPC